MNASIYDALKAMPYSLESEQSVIGGLLLDSGKFWDVQELVSEPDFYRQDHRLIFGVIRDLHFAREKVDVITISEALKAKGFKANDYGGLAYLTLLAKDTPSAANVTSYAKRVKQLSIKRQLIEGMQVVVGEALGNQGATDDELTGLIGAAQSLLARLELMQMGGDQSVTLSQSQKAALELMQLYEQKRGGVIGIDTGLRFLNDTIGGWHDTDYIVVQGRSGMGKTALALTFARAAAKQSRVGIISTEMADSQLGLRSISGGSGVDMGRIRRGQLEESDWLAISIAVKSDYLAGVSKNIRINDKALDIDTIKAQARAWKRDFGLELLILDYVQNVSVDRKGYGGSEKTATVMTVSGELKQLAKQLKIPVIALAQTKRDVDSRTDKRPSGADVMWAAQIEQDADVMLGAYRHEYYDKDCQDAKGMAELIITKNRHGATDTGITVFRPNRMDFVDAEEGAIAQYMSAINQQQNKRRSASTEEIF